MKIRMSAWVFLAALSLLGVSTSTMAQENGVLSGTVFEPSGVAVANSPVTLRWNDLGAPMSWDGVPRKRKRPHKKELRVFTDSAGRFSVRLLPGAWDVFAYHDGFAPVCKVVGVDARDTTTVELKFPRPVQTTIE